VYTSKNYQSKKELKADLAKGVKISYFQPAGMFPAPMNGRISLEGPHAPKPHKWYAQATVKNGYIISVT
jgi:hypothetical protein